MYVEGPVELARFSQETLEIKAELNVRVNITHIHLLDSNVTPMGCECFSSHKLPRPFYAE